MLHKEWKVKAKNPKNILATLLENRGITDTEEFLHPTHPNLFSLKELQIAESELKKAISLIEAAKKKKQTVVIYGDYDVDGTCATALLWRTLHEAGVIVFPFIPDRFLDGYGMTISGVNKIRELYKEVKLIITVDNGIVAQPAILEAQRHGIKVVVTDHHEASGENSADAIVHSIAMCGSALAWCVSCQFLKDKKLQDKNLDLVGIATIADQMKLIGINRSFAYHGIHSLRNSSRVGIKALCESSEVLLSTVGAYEIGYVLGPRINAAGRLSNGLDVVRLMCTNKISQAREISHSLSELNIKRQDITTEVLNAARVQSEAQEKIMLVVGAYHEGVIGLAAGKLVEETGRPAIVFSKGKTVTKGSARSISGFHITEALRVFEKLFINVGGHEMAAGFSMSTEALPEFIKKFTKYVSDNLPEALFVKTLKIDGEISFKDITKTLFEELKQLEPFGNGNPRPLFVTEGVQVHSLKTLGKSGDHLKLQLGNTETQFESLLFRAKNWELTPKVGENLDVVYSIDENSWNGKTTLQLLIKDFHEHKPKNPKPGIRKTQRVAPSKK